LEQFAKAQQILAERQQRLDPERILQQLDALYQEHGLFRTSLLRSRDDLPKPGSISRRFGSLDMAFQQLYRNHRDKARHLVLERICQQVPEVLSYSDFLVLDQKLAIAIQPSVPIPHGYAAYWPFRPDSRQVIDLTLGVLLADATELEILGYVALPRFLSGKSAFRVSAQSARVDQFGRCDLGFLQQLLEN
jgi:hypothetical protein